MKGGIAVETIGLGVIGAGIWGEAQARVFASEPSAELIAVCDVREERARMVKKKYGAKRWYTDVEEMMRDEEIHAVGIATPDFAHREPFVCACQAGKHILVEKPLATTEEDLLSMREALSRSQVKVMVDFHTRWNPAIVIAQRDIQEGKLGELMSCYYRLNDIIFVPTKMLSWASSSSILWFLGSHTVDTLRFLVGSEVKRVYAVSRKEVLLKMGIDVADLYQAILEFENGVVATIENNWIVPNTNPHWNDIKINLLGSKGMISMDLTNNQAVERYLEERSDHPDILIMPTVHGRALGFAHESIRDFVHRLVRGEEFLVGFEDGYRVSKVILALFQSAEERMPVEVQYE